MMMFMLILEIISCSHLRLHDGIDRCTRRLVWAILPLFTAAFAVMAWWGNPSNTTWAPLLLLASVATLGILLALALTALGDVGIAARELSAFHDQVVQTSEEEEHAATL